MSDIIIIEQDAKLLKNLKTNFKSKLQLNVIDKPSGKDVISLFQLVSDFELIIVRWDHCKEILNFLEKEQSSIPILVIGKKNSAYPYFFNLDSDITWENIIAKAERIINKTDSSDASEATAPSANNEKDFVGVSIHYFLALVSNNINCDIYIRLKKDEKTFNFVKRFNANEGFDNAEIEKYRDQGLKELYVKKEKHKYFLTMVKKELETTLQDESLVGTERIKITNEVYALSQERLQEIGIDEHTVEVVNQSLKSMYTSIGENNAMANFLRLLKDNNLGYAYSHSYLTSLILHKILQKFDWESGQIREKLTFIAYFHDISLNDSRLMQYHSQEELELSDLEFSEKSLVLNHAAKSASIVEKFPRVPAGVATVIKEHHGSKTGSGFMEELNTSLSPLSQMFVVVEHFVDSLLKCPQPASGAHIARIMKTLNERYDKGTYLQAVRAVEGMLTNKK